MLLPSSHFKRNLFFLVALLCFWHVIHGKLPPECFRDAGEAATILKFFDRLVTDGPSFVLLSNLTKIFENRNDYARHRQNQINCEKKIFLSIDDNFKSLDITIKLLHAHSDLKRSLSEARQTLNKIRFVFNALDLYERHKEFDSKQEASTQCELHLPRNSLTELQSQVTTAPRLFEEILEGTRYSQSDFENMTSVWLKQAGLCVLLMQACDKLKNTNASVELQNGRLEHATNMLKDIYQMLMDARQKLKRDFKFVVVEDISKTLNAIASSKGKSRMQSVELIHAELSKKFSFREWAVTMYDRVDPGAINVHAHEGSTDSWFMVNGAQHTVIAHSADNERNCKFFEDNFRNKTLKDHFNDEASFATFVNSDHYGHLGNAIGTLKQIFADRKLPQTYFFSVIAYQPSLVVKRGSRFHYFEHVRLSRSQDASLSVLIGWC